VTAETEPRRGATAGESAGVASGHGRLAHLQLDDGAPRADAAGIDLATVLGGVSAGITVQDASGRLLYANQVAARMSGFETAEELVAAAREDLVGRYVLLDESGRPFDVA